MLRVYVSPQRIHENRYSREGGDRPTIAVHHPDGRFEWAHELEILDAGGRVVAKLCSDMGDKPAGPTSVWLEVQGAHRIIHR